MKKITIALIALLTIALTACSNPISSEYDNNQDADNSHTPLYSGINEHG